MLVELERLDKLEEENRNLKSKNTEQFLEISELTRLVNSYQKIAFFSIAFMMISMLVMSFFVK
jgi:hypothetical protein